ncbi:MAG: VWA domain-containing protein [Chloroflexota bacterium]
MGFFAPLALVALPLLGLIIALYLLKLRRPSAPVASLHLWGSITRDREANSLWQRLRVSLLLLLQLAALLALILALARPWVPSEEAIGQNVVVIVDVSASMGTRDEDAGPTRLQLAQAKAKDIIDKMPQGASATVIEADNHAVIALASTDDRASLRDAVDKLIVRPVSTDLTEALKLASAVSSRQANSAVWLLSDGAFSSVSDLVDPLSGSLTFVPIGERSGNQGITALSLDKNGGALSLFLQVSNSEDVTVTRRLDLLADDAPWSARNVVVGPETTQDVVIDDVPISARVIGAELAGADGLDIDNRAWAVNRASVPANVLLVTQGNKFLELALSLLPTVTLYKVAPGDYDPDAQLGGTAFDVTIFDDGLPITATKKLPAGSLMAFALQPGNPIVTASSVVTAPILNSASPIEVADPSHRDPLLRFVDLSQLHVAKSATLTVPTWGHTVLSSDQGALMIAGEKDGRKIVAFGFDLHDTDLPVQTAFPLMIRNLITYLSPLPAGGIPGAIAPGETLAIEAATPGVDRIIVEEPTARELSYPVSLANNRVAFGDTTDVGVYYVTQYAGEDIVAQEAFAVNLFSRDESLTPPNASPGLPAAGAPLPGVNPAQAADTGVFRREVWPLLALAGFFVLLLEWLFTQRVVIRRAITEMQNRRALSKLEKM